MRVLFINPDVRNKSVIYGIRMLNPVPVNLAYRAALTRERYETCIVDENDDIPDYEQMLDDSNLVAITSKFLAEQRVNELVRFFRERGKPVIIDGYYPTFQSNYAALGATSVIQGEVEEVWPRILDDFERNRLLPCYQTSPVDLRALPYYTPELLPAHKYVFPVEATRGCPFACSFCIETRFHYDSFRTRPIEDVIHQIELGRNHLIHFADINIVGNLKHARELFTALKPVDVLWGSQATITLAQNPKLVELAAESGCMLVFIGLESVQPESTTSANKAWSKPINYPALIKRLHDHGIAVMGSFIFGFDTDGPDIFQRTLDFVQENEIEICHFNPLGPGAGTPLRETYLREGRLLETDVAAIDHFHISIRPARMTTTQIRDGLRFLYTQTYSREGVRRRLRRYRNSTTPIPGPRKQEKREIILALNVAYQQVVERHFGVHAGALAE